MNGHFSRINRLEFLKLIQFSLCGIPTNFIFAHRDILCTNFWSQVVKIFSKTQILAHHIDFTDEALFSDVLLRSDVSRVPESKFAIEVIRLVFLTFAISSSFFYLFLVFSDAIKISAENSLYDLSSAIELKFRRTPLKIVPDTSEWNVQSKKNFDG